MLAFLALAASGSLTPAGAQRYEDERRALGLSPDPLARSPRLLGMGRLTYTVDDPRNQISLWDFANNPTGVLDDDSTSTFELMPTTWAATSHHDLVDPGRLRERQDFAAREVRFGYETWRRNVGSSAYGLVGEVGLLRTDRPIDFDVAQRSSFTAPSFMGILNGHLPYLLSDRLQYALRAHFAYQTREDNLRRIVSNGAGDYIDVAGDLLPPFEFFTPDQWSVRSLGVGGALSLRLGKDHRIAGGYDQVGHLMKGRNDGGRYLSERRENRPYSIWQGSATGAAGPLEYGVDARSWTVDSKASFLFTQSTGSASNPLAGRGSFYRRSEDGSSVRGRLRWTLGGFHLGGGFGTYRRDVQTFIPDDTSSFNAFRNELYFIPSADTLFLPDSVANDLSEQKAWEAGGGIGWRSANRRVAAGVEYHRFSDQIEGVLLGPGPQRAGWDVRSGLEFGFGPALRVRGGYIHRWLDRDESTVANESLANAVTTGFGLSPVGATWSVETGFLYEWERADFGDPGRPRASRQELAIRLIWPL